MTVRAAWGALDELDEAKAGQEQHDPFDVADGDRIDLSVEPVPPSEWLLTTDVNASDARIVSQIGFLTWQAGALRDKGCACDIRSGNTTEDGHLPCIACPLGDQNLRGDTELAGFCRNGRRLEALQQEAEARIRRAR